MGRFNRIVSSPFRRCLQTAAVIASALGIEEVDVHKGLGENMASVKRDGWPNDDHVLTYLSSSAMAAVMEQQGVHLGNLVGEQPQMGEDTAGRFRSVIQALFAEGSDD